jgi:hypothetical protein
VTISGASPNHCCGLAFIETNGGAPSIVLLAPTPVTVSGGCSAALKSTADKSATYTLKCTKWSTGFIMSTSTISI